MDHRDHASRRHYHSRREHHHHHQHRDDSHRRRETRRSDRRSSRYSDDSPPERYYRREDYYRRDERHHRHRRWSRESPRRSRSHNRRRTRSRSPHSPMPMSRSPSPRRERYYSRRRQSPYNRSIPRRSHSTRSSPRRDTSPMLHRQRDPPPHFHRVQTPAQLPFDLPTIPQQPLDIPVSNELSAEAIQQLIMKTILANDSDIERLRDQRKQSADAACRSLQDESAAEDVKFSDEWSQDVYREKLAELEHIQRQAAECESRIRRHLRHRQRSTRSQPPSRDAEDERSRLQHYLESSIHTERDNDELVAEMRNGRFFQQVATEALSSRAKSLDAEFSANADFVDDSVRKQRLGETLQIEADEAVREEMEAERSLGELFEHVRVAGVPEMMLAPIRAQYCQERLHLDADTTVGNAAAAQHIINSWSADVRDMLVGALQSCALSGSAARGTSR